MKLEVFSESSSTFVEVVEAGDLPNVDQEEEEENVLEKNNLDDDENEDVKAKDSNEKKRKKKKEKSTQDYNTVLVGESGEQFFFGNRFIFNFN